MFLYDAVETKFATALYFFVGMAFFFVHMEELRIEKHSTLMDLPVHLRSHHEL